MMFNRRGNYSSIFGISSLVVLGFAAISIDWFRVRAADSQAQISADAASMAALIEFRYTGSTSDGEEAGNLILDSNIIAEDRGGVEVEYVWGNWDWGAPRESAWTPEGEPVNAVSTLVGRTRTAPNGEVPLFIAPAFGYESTEVWGSAIAAMRTRDIIVVLDVTESFEGEFPDAKQATLDFLDAVHTTAMPGDRIGMVTFVGAGIVHTPLQALEANYTTIRAQWEDLSTCNIADLEFDKYYQFMWVDAFGTLLDVTQFDALLRNDAPQMVNCWHGSDQDPLNYEEGVDIDTEMAAGFAPGGELYYRSSGTSQGGGIEVAMDEFEANETESSTPVIVLITDGRAQCVPEGFDVSCEDFRESYGITMADAADDEGISIFTVSFNDPFDADQSAYTESLTRGFGEFYETPDSEELPQILVDIASKIPTAVVN